MELAADEENLGSAVPLLAKAPWESTGAQSRFALFFGAWARAPRAGPSDSSFAATPEQGAFGGAPGSRSSS